MKVATVTLKGVTSYSPGKHVSVPPKEKEAKEDYEKRTWRERAHYDKDGVAFVPGMAFKKCLETAARFLSVNIKGRGKATYTKHFKAGVLVIENLSLGVEREDVEGNWLFVPSDGKPGGQSRVNRCFPIFHEWGGDVKFHILDDTITRPIFEQHIKEAGNFIGVGTFRPERGGYFGRFSVENIEWQEE